MLNEAYRTLRNQKTRVSYVVEISGGAGADSRNVPAELAELYLDLRDLLSTPGHADRLRQVESELENRIQELDRKLDELSGAFDHSKNRTEIVKELQNVLHQGNYADSMLRDLQSQLRKRNRS